MISTRQFTEWDLDGRGTGILRETAYARFVLLEQAPETEGRAGGVGKCVHCDKALFPAFSRAQ